MALKRKPFKTSELSAMRKFEKSQLLYTGAGSRKISVSDWTKYISSSKEDCLKGWCTPRFIAWLLEQGMVDPDEDIYCAFFTANELTEVVLEDKAALVPKVQVAVDSLPRSEIFANRK